MNGFYAQFYKLKQKQMKTHELVTFLKGIRVETDKYFSVMGSMMPSREIAVAITAAQNAKMWLGQVLKTLDQPNPYPDSKNAANTKIEPTADVYSGNIDSVLQGLSHIQQVKMLRQKLTASYEGLEEKQEELQANSELDGIGYHATVKAWEYLVESNMWLGMELGRINSETKKD